MSSGTEFGGHIYLDASLISGCYEMSSSNLCIRLFSVAQVKTHIGRKVLWNRGQEISLDRKNGIADKKNIIAVLALIVKHWDWKKKIRLLVCIK